MRGLALFFAGTALLAGQPSALEIIRRSAAVTSRCWESREAYKYNERDEERRLDSSGRVKSVTVDISQVVFVDGVPLEQVVGHNGGPATAAQKRKDREDIADVQSESRAERAASVRKAREQLAFVHEVPDAFQFHLIGEQTIGGRPAWVLEATPIPGYHGTGKYAKMFSKVRGIIWVDQQDYGWIKVEATVTDPFSVGLVVARIQPGSRIEFEQTRVAPGVWLPERIKVRAEARIFFFASHNTDETITFSNYRPAQPAELASADDQRGAPAGKYRDGKSQ